MLSAAFIYQLFITLSTNAGHFVYLIDDAYIHLTLAQSFANDLIPSINPGEFAHLSSSPLWTAILSFFYFIGLGGELLPLILNIIIAVFFTYYAVVLFLENRQSLIMFLIVYLLILLSGSLLALVFLGMEHLLHTFLSLIFLMKIYKLLTASETIEWKEKILLVLLTIMLTTVRYEAAILIVVGTAFLVYRKKYRISILIMLAGILPHLFIGIAALSNGWQFLPSSLILKSNLVMDTSAWSIVKSVLLSPMKKLVLNPELLALAIFVAGYSIMKFRNRRTAEPGGSTTLILLIVVYMHIIVAGVGWFYRYEAYLLILGIVIVGLIFDSIAREFSGKMFKAIMIVTLLLCFPFFIRAYYIQSEIQLASKNIYHQQYQTARFLSLNYNDEPIAVNDIGLVSYKTKSRIIDLWGLAYKPVFDLKRGNLYDTYKIEEILDREKVKVAAVYSEWFDIGKGFPYSWHHAGTMKIEDNVVCGSDAVSYFAKDSISFNKLKIHLEQFSNKLPNGVTLIINNKE